MVDKVVDKRGTRKVAEEYLKYLYSPEGQEIAGKNYYRPIDAKVAAKYSKQFAPVKLFTIDDLFGGWTKAQKTHFADGRRVRPDQREVSRSGLQPICAGPSARRIFFHPQPGKPCGSLIRAADHPDRSRAGATAALDTGRAGSKPVCPSAGG